MFLARCIEFVSVRLNPLDTRSSSRNAMSLLLKPWDPPRRRCGGNSRRLNRGIVVSSFVSGEVIRIDARGARARV